MVLLAPWWMELVAVISTLAAGVYIYFTIAFQYWKKRGVPYLEPSFPFGNMQDMATFRMSITEAYQVIYRKLAGNKMAGVYQMLKPTLLVRDPDLVKMVLAKDFSHFHDRGLYFDEERDPITGHLLFLEGTRWKHLRHKLTPIFTSGKMKMMFGNILNCGRQLVFHIDSMTAKNDSLEMKEVFAKYTIDVIASCAFGIQSNSLCHPDSEFHAMGRKITEPSWITGVQATIALLSPKLASILNIPHVPRHISNFFRDIVKETVDYRETNNFSRNDFIELLINIKNKKSVYDGQDLLGDNTEQEKMERNMYDVNGMTVDEIAAQAFVFFLAGFETSSTTMSFCLYELAVNPTVQERLRDEIDSVVADHDGKLTYEAMQQMTYLDNVVAETLRKYPPISLLFRKCTKDYQLPGTNAVMDKGTAMIVPVYALHHDPQYYPDPEVFDPDRFLDEVKSKRHHYVYLPFGEGPRICIGSRFGLMQTKVGLASLLVKYQFQVGKNMAVPLAFDRKSFVLTAAGGIHLEINKRSDASSSCEEELQF